MAKRHAVVLYCKSGQNYFFYVPQTTTPLTVEVQRNDSMIEVANRWVEAKGFSVVDISSFITKDGQSVLCEVQAPKNRQLQWETRTNIVHGSQYSDELSVLVQIAYDRLTGKGQRY